MGADQSDKLESLESLRGIAAGVVVTAHCLLAFYPQFFASMYDGPKPSAFQVNAGPWFIFFNGPAAVLIFFVLSGFVLTRRYFLQADARVLLAPAIKRWPRLMGLVVVSTTVSATLLTTLPDYTIRVAEITGSSWLYGAGVGGLQGRSPSFADALLQGSLLTFFRGDSYYNASLWTMWWEFTGSFIVFLFAFLVTKVRMGVIGPAAVMVVFLTLAALWSPYISAFVIGSSLSYLLAKKPIALPTSAGLALVAFGVLALGFHPYGWLGLDPLAKAGGTVGSYIWIAAATALMIAFTACEPISRAIGIFAWLGRISFALYVIHLAMIAHVGCLVYLSAPSSIAAPAAFLASAVAAFAAAIPLSALDRWWLKRLGVIDGIPMRLKNPLRRRIAASA